MDIQDRLLKHFLVFSINIPILTYLQQFTEILALEMGADGGSIPMRIDVVKRKAKTSSIDDTEILKTRWTTCFISKEPLTRPIVACTLGRLYNKDEVIKFLINRQDYDPALKAELDHLKSLKTLINCNLTDSKSSTDTQNASTTTHYFACPVTGREMNGKSKFFVTKKCGCVLSEQAVNQFPDTTTCLVCERKEFSASKDLLELYPKTVKKSTKRSLDTTTTVSDTSSTASLLLEEIKSSGNEISSLKKSKVTQSLYFSNKTQ